MTIFIAGGTGFLGQALVVHLRTAGHTVRVLTRHATGEQRDALEWRPDGSAGAWARAIDGADAVVNLSGAGIADGRWTDARKDVLRSSRLLSTRSLVAAIAQASRPPVLVNASGIGYYGDRGAELVSESTPAGNDFLARLCIEWEAEAARAAPATRVAILRNAVVLHPSGGALAKMLWPFRLGVGGRLGSGEQYFAWIHLADWLGLVTTIITTADARGPFNVTSPHPVSNADFTRALGQALGRPTIIPVPAFGLRVVLGELADTLLAGQRAVPAHAEQLGFRFRFGEIAPALADLLRATER